MGLLNRNRNIFDYFKKKISKKYLKKISKKYLKERNQLIVFSFDFSLTVDEEVHIDIFTRFGVDVSAQGGHHARDIGRTTRNSKPFAPLVISE